MKFLFDEQLPPRVARALRQLGEPVSHVQDVAELGKGSPDDEILEYAGKRDYFLVTLGPADSKEAALARKVHGVRMRRLLSSRGFEEEHELLGDGSAHCESLAGNRRRLREEEVSVHGSRFRAGRA